MIITINPLSWLGCYLLAWRWRPPWVTGHLANWASTKNIQKNEIQLFSHFTWKDIICHNYLEADKKNDKLQSTLLKFGVYWILYIESLVPLAKLHPLLVLVVKWYVGMLMWYFFFFLGAKLASQNDIVSLKTKSIVGASKKMSFWEANLVLGKKYTSAQ